MFIYNFKKPINLKKPKTLNEKLQWLKLNTYYDNPIVTKCVDKLRVKEYLEERGYGYLCAKVMGGGVYKCRRNNHSLGRISREVCN